MSKVSIEDLDVADTSTPLDHELEAFEQAWPKTHIDTMLHHR